MLAGRKYRLALTPEQAEFAETIGGICRSAWNRRLQKKLARQRRGSANWRKTIAAIRRIKRRERDRRGDFAAHVANRLATRNSVVVLEELQMRNMTRSAKGSVDEPGTRVAQNAGLNWAILEKGWHSFELALNNVARRTGCGIVKVPAAYTSQRCCVCRSVDPENRESQAVFRCTTGGHTENADVNAAKNILAGGLAVTACGDPGVARSVKQEPVGNREEVPHQPAPALVGIHRLIPKSQVEDIKHTGVGRRNQAPVCRR